MLSEKEFQDRLNLLLSENVILKITLKHYGEFQWMPKIWQDDFCKRMGIRKVEGFEYLPDTRPTSVTLSQVLKGLQVDGFDYGRKSGTTPVWLLSMPIDPNSKDSIDSMNEKVQAVLNPASSLDLQSVRKALIREARRCGTLYWAFRKDGGEHPWPLIYREHRKSFLKALSIVEGVMKGTPSVPGEK